MPFPEQETQEKSKFGNRDVAFRFKYTDAGGIFEHICLVGSWKYSCGAEDAGTKDTDLGVVCALKPQIRVICRGRREKGPGQNLGEHQDLGDGQRTKNLRGRQTG